MLIKILISSAIYLVLWFFKEKKWKILIIQVYLFFKKEQVHFIFHSLFHKSIKLYDFQVYLLH